MEISQGISVFHLKFEALPNCNMNNEVLMLNMCCSSCNFSKKKKNKNLSILLLVLCISDITDSANALNLSSLKKGKKAASERERDSF